MTRRTYLIAKAHGQLEGISKAPKRNRDASNAALTASGATIAGTSLVAGGIPGVRPNPQAVWRMKGGSGKGVRRAVSTVRGAAPAAPAAPGGILGYRYQVHRGGLYGFDEADKKARRTKQRTATENFYRHHNAGKIQPEKDVMRGMRIGHKVSNATLAAGGGLALLGVARSRHDAKRRVRKADRRSRSYNGALVGVGGTGLALSQGGHTYLGTQERKYGNRASLETDRAGKLVPGIAGRTLRKPTEQQKFAHKVFGVESDLKQTMYPKVSDGEIGRHNLMRGVNRRTAAEAGRLRGAAAQHRHFSEVFRNTKKVVGGFRTPSAVVAAAGAGGLYVTRRRKPVRKSLPTASLRLHKPSLRPTGRRWTGDTDVKRYDTSKLSVEDRTPAKTEAELMRKSFLPGGNAKFANRLSHLERRNLKFNLEQKARKRGQATLPGLGKTSGFSTEWKSQGPYHAAQARKVVRRTIRVQQGQKVSPVRGRP